MKNFWLNLAGFLLGTFIAGLQIWTVTGVQALKEDVAVLKSQVADLRASNPSHTSYPSQLTHATP